MSAHVSTPTARVNADLGIGMGVVPATSWQVRRSLSGSGLPGQARATTGSSVGTGSLDVVLPTSVIDGLALAATPWRGGIAPDGPVSVSMVADHGAPEVMLARMACRDVGAPGALTPVRSLDIEDDLTGLRQPLALDSQLPQSAVIDAAWVIDQAARASGYYATPPMAPSTIVSVPLCGHVLAERGITSTVSTPSWVTVGDQQIHPSDLNLHVFLPTPLMHGGSMFFGLSGDAPWTMTLPSASAMSGVTHTITVAFDGVSTIRLTHDAGGYVDIPVGAVRPHRLYVQVERTTTTVTRARVRSSAVTTWSTWRSAAGPTLALDEYFEDVQVTGQAIGVQVTTADEDSLVAVPTARIASSGSVLRAVVMSGSRTAWDLVQEIAAATLGAVWITAEGHLAYRDAAYLRGLSTTPREEIVSLRDLTEVPWSLSRDETADRVEVQYTPVTVTQASTADLLVWEATEPIEVPARGTVTHTVDLDARAASQLVGWVPIWSTAAPSTRYSRWAAAVSPDGGGTQPADGALQITAALLSPSRVQITIRNTTGATLWTVDGTGTPTLILRARTLATASEARVVAAGAPTDTARNVLTHEAGAWVQDDAVAREILTWLTSQTAAPRPVLASLDIVPSPTRRLGDQVVLVDPLNSIRSRALVTAIENTGGPGRWEQKVTLTLLDPLVANVDASLTGLTVADVNALILAELGPDATVAQADTWLAARGVS